MSIVCEPVWLWTLQNNYINQPKPSLNGSN